jgi:pimeloyl-ACP methyl ester carboxylesterase
MSVGSKMHNFCRLIFNKSSYISCSAKLTFLKVSEGTIEYSRFGKGEPLVLVSGSATSMNGWDLRFLDELAKSYEVIVFSNRNTGGSKFTSKEYTIESLAGDIESIRVRLDLSVISLVGISLGGAIAQQYACMYPQNLKHLTLINTFPPGNLMVQPKADVIKVLENIGKSKLLNYPRLAKLLLPSLWSFLTIAVFHFKTQGSKNLVPASTLKEQASIIKKWSTHANPVSILEVVKVPTLILVGEMDKLVPPANSQVLRENIKNSKLISFTSGRHIMFFQYPQALAQVITNDLRGNTNAKTY